MNPCPGEICVPSCSKVLTLKSIQDAPRFALVDRLGQFPIGIAVDGKWLKRFRFKPYITEHDFILSEFYKEDETVPLRDLVEEFFPVIFESIEGYTFKEIASALGIRPYQLYEQLFLPDVLVAVLNLRYNCYGGEIHFTGYCPSCGKRNEDKPELGISHSIEGVDFPCFDIQGNFAVEVHLEDGFKIGEEICKKVAMRPLTVSQYSSGDGELDILMGQICHFMGQVAWGITPEQFCGLQSIRDRAKLFSVSRALNTLLPDVSAFMICRNCSWEWVMSLPMDHLGDFYTNLLRPPPPDYLRELLFFLTFGEQAPCKSIHEARQISVQDRNFWVKKLSESYQRQKDEMDKSNRKSKSKNTTTY